MMLVPSGVRVHIAGTKWSTKRYLNMKLLKQQEMDEPKSA
jgi:hypothetical protein